MNILFMKEHSFAQQPIHHPDASATSPTGRAAVFRRCCCCPRYWSLSGRSVRSTFIARRFANRLTLTKDAIDEIEREQADLNAHWLKLAKRSDVVKREEILSQLAQSRSQMSIALESAYEQAEYLRESIYSGEPRPAALESFGSSAAASDCRFLCAIWLVRASTSVFARLEHQARELTDVQYQFLETQENIARRFSHELHDELGQALTAVKANLSCHARRQPIRRESRTAWSWSMEQFRTCEKCRNCFARPFWTTSDSIPLFAL